MNDWQKSRFTKNIVSTLFNTVTGKRIALLGWAFKKDTNDTRESAAIYVCRDLLLEEATVAVYDPEVDPEQMKRDLLYAGLPENLLDITWKSATARLPPPTRLSAPRSSPSGMSSRH